MKRRNRNIFHLPFFLQMILFILCVLCNPILFLFPFELGFHLKKKCDDNTCCSFILWFHLCPVRLLSAKGSHSHSVRTTAKSPPSLFESTFLHNFLFPLAFTRAIQQPNCLSLSSDTGWNLIGLSQWQVSCTWEKNIFLSSKIYLLNFYKKNVPFHQMFIWTQYFLNVIASHLEKVDWI